MPFASRFTCQTGRSRGYYRDISFKGPCAKRLLDSASPSVGSQKILHIYSNQADFADTRDAIMKFLENPLNILDTERNKGSIGFLQWCLFFFLLFFRVYFSSSKLSSKVTSRNCIDHKLNVAGSLRGHFCLF